MCSGVVLSTDDGRTARKKEIMLKPRSSKNMVSNVGVSENSSVSPKKKKA